MAVARRRWPPWIFGQGKSDATMRIFMLSVTPRSVLALGGDDLNDRDWSAGESADPVGRHRPRSKTLAQCPRPDDSDPVKAGWRCKGFHVGRDSMSCASSANRTVSRSAPNASGSIRTQVSQ